MTMEDGFKAFLASSPYPLVCGSRVYNARAPQNPTTPYVVFHRIAVQPSLSHGGGSADYVKRRYQFSAWSTSQSQAQGLADSLRKLMQGYKGLMGDVYVAMSSWQGELQIWDDTAAPPIVQVAVDFDVAFIEQFA